MTFSAAFRLLSSLALCVAFVGCDDAPGVTTDFGAIASDAGSRDAGVVIDPDSGTGNPDAGPRPDDAGTSVGADPTTAGPRSVSTMSDTVMVDDRATPVTAYVPDGAPGPLVVFLPGFQLESSRYAPLCERLASHGFTVVAADPEATLLGVSHVDMREDAIGALDWAQSNLTLSTGVGFMGHSLGGKVSTMVAGQDARVDAVFGIDPVNGGNPFSGYSDTLPDIVPDVTSTLTMPVGWLGETTNGSGGTLGMACAPTDQNYATFYESTTMASWAAEWTYPMADHMDFVIDTAGCGFTCTACTDGGADAADVQRDMYTLVVAFFRRHLLADAAMEPFLTGGSVPPAVSTRFR